jgi:hypothetical protein
MPLIVPPGGGDGEATQGNRDHSRFRRLPDNAERSSLIACPAEFDG